VLALIQSGVGAQAMTQAANFDPSFYGSAGMAYYCIQFRWVCGLAYIVAAFLDPAIKLANTYVLSCPYATEHGQGEEDSQNSCLRRTELVFYEIAMLRVARLVGKSLPFFVAVIWSCGWIDVYRSWGVPTDKNQATAMNLFFLWFSAYAQTLALVLAVCCIFVAYTTVVTHYWQMHSINTLFNAYTGEDRTQHALDASLEALYRPMRDYFTYMGNGAIVCVAVIGFATVGLMTWSWLGAVLGGVGCVVLGMVCSHPMFYGVRNVLW
jgi:hypothetical protein